jgi:hypothetical protein
VWESDRIAPGIAEPEDGAHRLRDVAEQEVSDLRFDLSLDPEWRRILFGATPHERIQIPTDHPALSQRVRDLGLHFAAFNDGWTDDGFVVFGISSVEFPDVVTYTTNNPGII